MKKTDAHPLIASAAFHYEFEFIHPFSDRNGRIGRFWQTLVLKDWHPLLAFLPAETVIKARQEEYYQSLREADAKSDCSVFIELLLSAINQSLTEAIQSEEKARVKTTDQILEVLKESPHLALIDVANRIGRSVSTVEREVSKLKQGGRLEYHGPKKMVFGWSEKFEVVVSYSK
ncbi:Fic family protein [Marinomonas algicola]|uniref:Fic family protein n=1 Tax=Marinomonas algicola TaxID=2773454 RepID=UPI001EFF3FCE|nr:Fic family protein [Marinomonas algicola]